MKIINISEEEFEEFRNNNTYDNFCQTSNYGSFMKKQGFDFNYIGYINNEREILAASLVLTKKIKKRYYYAYCPKGFLIDYNNNELVKKFIKSLIRYYRRRKIIFLKINPEIQIATINPNNDYERIPDDNEEILNYLKKLKFKKRREIKPFELLEPKLTSIIDLKNFDTNNMDKDIKEKIEISKDNGLEIIEGNSSNIDDLYEISKEYTLNNKEYYKDLYEEFNKNKESDIFLVKVNYETYLINAKKRVEKEEENNNEINKKFKDNKDDTIFEEKMKSDKDLEKFKQDIVFATNGLKNKNNSYVAGALVIKHNKKVSIVLIGKTDEYDYLYPQYFLYYKLINKYKKEYDYIDLYGIASDFDEKSKYYDINKLKIDFNSNIIEYIGELDIIINKWKFRIIEKNNSLSNEFVKTNINKKN